MTIPYVSWGYHRSEAVARTRKNPAQLVEQIVHATSRGGNLLLNFGPTGDGSLPPFERDIARRIGDRFTVDGEAVHGCGPATDWTPPAEGSSPSTWTTELPAGSSRACRSTAS